MSEWFYDSVMDPKTQEEWLTTHIPHRVRAAIARLPLEDSVLRVDTRINLTPRTDAERIYWRCATDSIFQGRLAATRWLIEFIGIKADKNIKPVKCDKDSRNGDDVRINDLGGELLSPEEPPAGDLARVWKGCSKVAMHATDACRHPEVEDPQLVKALKVITEHLQNQIYKKAGKQLRDYVLEPEWCPTTAPSSS